MQEKITFIFEKDESKNSFLQCYHALNQIQDAVTGMGRVFFRSSKALNNNINPILTLIISGGTLSAIILSIKEIVLKYLDKGNTVLTIQKGDRKLEIHYDNKNRHLNVEDLVNEELIRELFLSEDEEQSKTK